MIRTFGVQTLGATSQPWFADTLTAAIAAQPKNVNDNQAFTLVSVAASSKYRIGDPIIVGAGTATEEAGLVKAIPAGGTTLQVTGLSKAHASGDFISLDIYCFDVTVQLLDGSTGAMYLGSDKTVTATPGGNVFWQLQKVAAGSATIPWHYSQSLGIDGVRSGDGWVVGTTGDKYIAAAYIL